MTSDTSYAIETQLIIRNAFCKEFYHSAVVYKLKSRYYFDLFRHEQYSLIGQYNWIKRLQG